METTTSRKVVRIDEIARRLAALGISYRTQGGQVIRCVWSDGYKAIVEEPMHYSITSVNEAVAREAGRVLADRETVAAGWADCDPDGNGYGRGR